MNPPDDGGAAFEQDEIGYNIYADAHTHRKIGGMTLRQYYAGLAMQELLSWGQWGIMHPDEADAAIAERAFGMASAMLKESSKAPTKEGPR